MIPLSHHGAPSGPSQWKIYPIIPHWQKMSSTGARVARMEHRPGSRNRMLRLEAPSPTPSHTGRIENNHGQSQTRHMATWNEKSVSPYGAICAHLRNPWFLGVKTIRVIWVICGPLCFHSRLFVRIRGLWEFCAICANPRDPWFLVISPFDQWLLNQCCPNALFTILLKFSRMPLELRKRQTPIRLLAAMRIRPVTRNAPPISFLQVL
jgi:hypothetical protein